MANQTGSSFGISRVGGLGLVLTGLLTGTGLLAWTFPRHCVGVSRYCDCLSPPARIDGAEYWAQLFSGYDNTRELGRQDGRVYLMSLDAGHGCRYRYWADEAEVGLAAPKVLKEHVETLTYYGSVSPGPEYNPKSKESKLFRLLTDYRSESGMTPAQWARRRPFWPLAAPAQRALLAKLEAQFRQFSSEYEYAENPYTPAQDAYVRAWRPPGWYDELQRRIWSPLSGFYEN